MKKSGCINPVLSEVLAYCGHGDQILIADGNFPLATKCPDTRQVFLAVKPGLPTATDVLEALLTEINVEAAFVMLPESGERPEIFGEFEERLPGVELQGLERNAFYTAAAQPKVRMAISTGEKRVFGNLLITIGVA